MQEIAGSRSEVTPACIAIGVTRDRIALLEELVDRFGTQLVGPNFTSVIVVDEGVGVGAERLLAHHGTPIVVLTEEQPLRPGTLYMVAGELPDALDRATRGSTHSMQIVLEDRDSPARVASQIRAFVDGHDPRSTRLACLDTRESVLRAIYERLHEYTGRDFTLYRASSVRRSIEQRMRALGVSSLQDYQALLRLSPAESERVLHELLTTSSAFLHESETVALDRAIDELVRRKTDGAIRAWIPACSTGEEAYAIAMAIAESRDRVGSALPVQIFASDFDRQVIDTARLGIYSTAIVNEIGAARASRHFDVIAPGKLQIREEIRQTLVFTHHDLLADPPFSRLDLVCIRTLFVYATQTLQRRLMPTFHRALVPGGLLLLGDSDSPPHDSLYEAIVPEQRCYRRRSGPARPSRASRVARVCVDLALDSPPTSRRAAFQLLLPPSVLVRGSGEILEAYGSTADLFDLPSAEQSLDVTTLARGALGPEVASALRQARTDHTTVLRERIVVETRRGAFAVDVRIEPVATEEDLFLVAFERFGPRTVEPTVDELQLELACVRLSCEELALRLERANFRLRSADEEQRSLAEELATTNEELVISRDDAVSLEREVRAIGEELANKSVLLARERDDAKNVYEASQVAAILLDRSLAIRDYTEDAARIVPLRRSDIGRPLGHVAASVLTSTVVQLAGEAYDRRAVVERELVTNDTRTYLVRVAPYLCRDRQLDGVVVAFTDVTRTKSVQDQEVILGALAFSPTVVFAFDRDSRIVWTCAPLFGHAASDVIGKSIDVLFPDTVAVELEAYGRLALDEGRSQRFRVHSSYEGWTSLDLFLQPALVVSGTVERIDVVMTRYERGMG